jgi:hypothetical protein
MSLSFDAESSVQQASGVTNWSWTHTPSSGTDAVLVLVANNWLGSETMSAVTYGGVALSKVDSLCANNVGADRPTVQAWFKSGGLPSGAQTVAVTDTSNVAKLGACYGLLATAGAEVQTSSKDDNGGTAAANPQVTLSCESSRDAFIAGILGSGDNTATATDDSGQTRTNQYDFGTTSGYVSRKTSIHTGGSTTFGYTQESFQLHLLAVAVSESVVPWVPRAIVIPG